MKSRPPGLPRTTNPAPGAGFGVLGPHGTVAHARHRRSARSSRTRRSGRSAARGIGAGVRKGGIKRSRSRPCPGPCHERVSGGPATGTPRDAAVLHDTAFIGRGAAGPHVGVGELPRLRTCGDREPTQDLRNRDLSRTFGLQEATQDLRQPKADSGPAAAMHSPRPSAARRRLGTCVNNALPRTLCGQEATRDLWQQCTAQDLRRPGSDSGPSATMRCPGPAATRKRIKICRSPEQTQGLLWSRKDSGHAKSAPRLCPSEPASRFGSSGDSAPPSQ
jgi:hypothetical protein